MSAGSCRITRVHWLALGAVLVLAGGLRFGEITQVGIRFVDEAAYANDARLWHRCARVLTHPDAIQAVFHGDKERFQKRMNACGVDFGARYLKPNQGYTFLGAAAMFVVGDRPEALLVLNALLGTIAVLALYALAATLFNRTIALVAALLLSISPYHLVYCRSALADTSTGAFILAGALFWALGHRGMWSWRRAYLLSGLALGWAITCHYRSAYVPAILILTDLMAARQVPTDDRSAWQCWRNVLRRWIYLAVGVAVPLLTIEAVFRAARLAAAISDSGLPLATYWEGGWHWVKLQFFWNSAAASGSILTHRLLTLPTYFIHWHGVAAAGLGSIGLFIALRTKGAAKLPAVFVIVSFLIVVLQSYTVARTLSVVVPFMCLCLAVGLQRFINAAKAWRRIQPVWAVVLTALVIAPALLNSARLYGKRSNLADACAFVADRGGRVAVFDEWKYPLYLQPSDTVNRLALRDVVGADEVLDHLRGIGVRWMIADPQYWHYRGDNFPWNRVFERWKTIYGCLDRNAVCVAEFDHMADYRWEFLAEGPGVQYLEEMTRAGAGRLRVYDLSAQMPVARAGDEGAASTSH